MIFSIPKNAPFFLYKFDYARHVDVKFFSMILTKFRDMRQRSWHDSFKRFKSVPPTLIPHTRLPGNFYL